MSNNNRKSDYQIVADAYGVTVEAVRKAVQRADEYPNNRLVITYNSIQDAKEKALTRQLKKEQKKKMTA